MSKFIAVLAACSLCAVALAEDTKQVATASAFTALDKNADNQISKTEAGIDRKLSDGFAYVDTNGDGFISRTEYLAQGKSTREAT
jgi:Ca2+-binding EF-hand superfamily protein